MDKAFEKYQKRRLRSSYLSVIVSIGLVLFLIGILGLIVLKTNKLTEHFKEKVAITVFLKDNAKNSDIQILKAELEKAEYTKSIVFISKDVAAKKYSEEIGEDFLEFLGENPLKDAIDVSLLADFVTPEKMQAIEDNLKIRSIVSEVAYDKPLIDLLTKNITRLSF